MKKNYIEPQVKEVKVSVEHHVCSDSNVGVGPTQETPLTPSGKEDDFDEWGW